MEVIPNIKPSPRLLNSAAVEVRTAEGQRGKSSGHKLKRTNGFAGNGRAIFMGLLVGALLVTGTSYVASRKESVEDQLASVRRFLAVRTSSIATVRPPSDSASPLSVQIDPSMLRVTAIALGHPRLAIINGKEVTEGDSITLTSRDGGISVSLRILNIVEGRIELTDGTHVLTAPLANGTGGHGR